MLFVKDLSTYYLDIVIKYIFRIIRKKKINNRSPIKIEKSQSSGKRIKPETRGTSFPALSVYPRVRISRAASETDDSFYFSIFFLLSFFFPERL